MYDHQLGGQVRIPKTAEVLAARIRKQIIRGELRPGDKLPPEAALIAEFEVSRPTIREAIRILESEALISVSRGARGGAKINAPSADLVTRAVGVALQARGATLRDIYEVRSMMEPPAARMAAEASPKEAAEALRAQVAREWAVGEDDVARAKGIADFHRLLLESSGNPVLAVVGGALQAIVERHMQLAYRQTWPRPAPAKRVSAGLRSHEKLVDLIEAGDGAGAEAHWIRHMAAAGETWLKDVGGTAVVDVLE